MTSPLPPASLPTLTLTPIGIARTPFTDKGAAPRQPAAARGTPGRIELSELAAYEHALCDLDQWSHIWVLFWFHHNPHWHAKVLPPRSTKKRGVFATRSPHRPNPIGLSVVRLVRVEGLVLHIEDLDLLDGTPVLDIKPYVPYADSVPSAGNGWLEEDARDAGPTYNVTWSERAEEQLAWLATRTSIDLRALAEAILRAGPTPHPYRRIRSFGDHLRLSIKDFRLRFTLEGQSAHVLELDTGYRKRVLADATALATAETSLAVHRELVARFFADRT